MKPFEILYLGLEPFLPPLHGKVRRRLVEIAKPHAYSVAVLDVGGRKSHYTIGVPAHVAITDIPRATDVQKQLHLGVTKQIVTSIRRRRSNVRTIIFDDMTRSALASCSFEYVVAVEVLEHVEEDQQFVQEVHRVLKPGGTFLMTTPNGDFVANTNPDHKRHYTREQLRQLLTTLFATVEIEYAIQGGMFRSQGLQSWSARRPARTLLSMTGNLINGIQSSRNTIKDQSQHTHHLIALARK